MASNSASVQRNGTSLVFSGVLDRAAVTALWPSLTALDGVQQLDLAAVSKLDSAGLALLAELAARLRATGTLPTSGGSPDGFTDLSAAYRLAPTLDFHALSAAS
ncbi:STAS domain-containing protein [Stenotrophomonas sp.]|uniref:STAS domain-containing protein n=1 Tax=Stenotrophomonas sp. TaxID=69392 RepID=UPI0025CB8165|nr:STAS domain-containing protein [Stenotrophomonas sp.]MBW8372840.1 STAS domain-containing protein [Stenotrophomonas sp.]